MFRLFIKKDFESKGGRKSKRKRKRENVELWYMRNVFTKYGIYCNYSKWICSSTEKYHKNPDEYLRNYKVK